MTTQTIPVVSLKDFSSADAETRDRFIKTVGEALRDVGFFALTDHGVDTAVIHDAYRVAEEFYKLPDQTKRQYIMDNGGQRGFTAFGTEHAKDHDAPDLKEFWHVGQEFSPSHPLYDKYPQNIWPSEPSAFRDVYTKLFAQLEVCAMAILKSCALFIGEEEDRFSGIARDGNTILRIIHYPPVPEDAHPASVRAAAHEDINLITLLCEATAGGLELLERNGSWRPIHALEGQIIVDSGDMLQNITNGYYRSTTHRVVNPDNSRERRFSMPFFVHPRSEASLDPLPSCVELSGGKKTYPNITAGAYLEQRLREIGLTK